MRTDLDFQSYQKWFVEDCIYKDGTLTINLVGGVTSDEKVDVVLDEKNVIKGCYPVEPIGEKYVVYFDDVVLLQIYDECASKFNEFDVRDEGVVGIFTSSSLLEHVKTSTLINEITLGDLIHFEVRTGEDWYHVISREKPDVFKRAT